MGVTTETYLGTSYVYLRMDGKQINKSFNMHACNEKEGLHTCKETNKESDS